MLLWRAAVKKDTGGAYSDRGLDGKRSPRRSPTGPPRSGADLRRLRLPARFPARSGTSATQRSPKSARDQRDPAAGDRFGLAQGVNLGLRSRPSRRVAHRFDRRSDTKRFRRRSPRWHSCRRWPSPPAPRRRTATSSGPRREEQRGRGADQRHLARQGGGGAAAPAAARSVDAALLSGRARRGAIGAFKGTVIVLLELTPAERPPPRSPAARLNNKEVSDCLVEKLNDSVPTGRPDRDNAVRVSVRTRAPAPSGRRPRWDRGAFAQVEGGRRPLGEQGEQRQPGGPPRFGVARPVWRNIGEPENRRPRTNNTLISGKSEIFSP